MESQPQTQSAVLEIAWTRFAQLDAAAGKRARAHLNLRRWVAIMGVLATFFAITTEMYPANFPVLGVVTLKILLVLSPILASLLAAYINKFYSSGDWLITRAASEEILKNIYIYRTILQNTTSRRNWLEKRLQENQRSVYNGMNGELTLEPYFGIIPPPPRFEAQDPNNDSGFHDLTGDEYFTFRLDDQLAWHIMKVIDRQRERRRLQLFILGSGAAGAILAAVGAAFDGPFILWVALAAAFTSAFIGWEELRSLDLVVRNYSKVIMELNILSDHWRTLTSDERTQSEFNRMVRSTEQILWSRNVEYIKAMQEALEESNLEEEAGLINRVIQEQRDSDKRFKKSMEDAVVNKAQESLAEAEEVLAEAYENALSTLVEEASSEIVQQELAAMQHAVQEIAQEAAEQFGLWARLEKIAVEFEGVEIGPNTPPGVLNDLIKRYPKSQQPKG